MYIMVCYRMLSILTRTQFSLRTWKSLHPPAGVGGGLPVSVSSGGARLVSRVITEMSGSRCSRKSCCRYDMKEVLE